MANRFVFAAFVVNGLFLLTACTTVQTASVRQTYFEHASTAKLAWRPVPNNSMSFQGCSWDSKDYPCQPYSQLTESSQSAGTSLRLVPSVSPAHEKVHHKKKGGHAKALPLCQPAPKMSNQPKSVENNSVLANKTST